MNKKEKLQSLIKNHHNRPELAAFCGCSYQTIKNIELGIYEAGTDIFFKLCDFFKVDPKTLAALPPGRKIKGKIKKTSVVSGIGTQAFRENSADDLPDEIELSEDEARIILKMRSFRSKPGEIAEFRDRVMVAPIREEMKLTIYALLDEEWGKVLRFVSAFMDNKPKK